MTLPEIVTSVALITSYAVYDAGINHKLANSLDIQEKTISAIEMNQEIISTFKGITDSYKKMYYQSWDKNIKIDKWKSVFITNYGITDNWNCYYFDKNQYNNGINSSFLKNIPINLPSFNTNNQKVNFNFDSTSQLPLVNFQGDEIYDGSNSNEANGYFQRFLCLKTKKFSTDYKNNGTVKNIIHLLSVTSFKDLDYNTNFLYDQFLF